MNASFVSPVSALRAHDGLVVALALCVGPPLVLGLIGLMTHRAGASLRPIVVIGALMLPIVIVFVVGQLVRARMPAPSTPAFALDVRDGRFVERDKLFGPGIAPELIREAKSGLPGILDEAEMAEIGMTMTGETVLVAQFPGDAETKRAAGAYDRGFRLTGSSGDEEKGWRGRRMQGDYVEMLRTERQLFVWTGLTPEAAASRRAASKLAAHYPALVSAPRAPLIPALQPLGEFFAPALAKIIGIVLLIGLYAFGFFKGISWAGSERPADGVLAVSPQELVARLLAINGLDLPFEIHQGDSPDELIADWRYADARWIDFVRAHGIKKTFRIRLKLDHAKARVLAADYTAELDWSASRSSADIHWRMEKGVVFFAKEQQTVLGFQIDDDGHLKPVASYTYKFDLNEMKSPIAGTVTRSGWVWSPAAW